MSSKPYARRDVAAVGLLTAVAHFTYLVASNRDFFFPDSFTYLIPARNLLHGLGFVSWPGVAETLRTPGYPLLLVPFVAATSSPVPIVIVQHLLAIVLAIAVTRIALRWGASRPGAIAAGLCAGLDVPSIHYANKVLSESVFSAGILLVVWLAWTSAERLADDGFAPRGLAVRAAGLGLLTGGLVLVRPVAIVWFVAVAAAILASGKTKTAWPPRRYVAFAAVLATVALAVPLAWGLRNSARTGVFTVSSIGGSNMLMYRAAGAIAIEQDYAFKQALADAQSELKGEVDDEIVEKEDVDRATDVPHAVLGRYYARRGREVMLQHPWGSVMLGVRGVLVLLFESDWEAVMMVSRLPSPIVQLGIDALQHAIIVLAVIGIVPLWRRSRTAALLVVLTILYFVGISAGGEAEARFRVPIAPLIAILAGAGVEAVARGVSTTPAPGARP